MTKIHGFCVFICLKNDILLINTNRPPVTIIMTTVITDKNQFETIIKTQNFVLVDFHADWCGPCQAMKPIVHNIADEFNGTLSVLTVNTDNNNDIAQKWNIRSLPTFLMFYRGTAVKKLVGADPDKLKEAVKELCKRK